jgi:hypothetical protein
LIPQKQHGHGFIIARFSVEWFLGIVGFGAYELARPDTRLSLVVFFAGLMVAAWVAMGRARVIKNANALRAASMSMAESEPQEEEPPVAPQVPSSLPVKEPAKTDFDLQATDPDEVLNAAEGEGIRQLEIFNEGARWAMKSATVAMKKMTLQQMVVKIQDEYKDHALEVHQGKNVLRLEEGWLLKFVPRLPKAPEEKTPALPETEAAT